MKIIERSVGDYGDPNRVIILDIYGSIDAETSQNIRESVEKWFETNNVLLNFVSVPYMDSIAVVDLDKLLETVKKHGGKLKLMGISRKLRNLAILMHLAEVFETFDIEDEAVASFRAQAA